MKYDKRNYEGKPPWRIFLDLDGVCCDFDGQRDSAKYNHYKSTDDLPFEFWYEMPWLPKGRELYNELGKLAPVTILTAPSNKGCSAHGKVEWINRELKTRDYLIGGAKWVCAASNHILIDDNLEKVTRFISGGGKAILYPRNSDQIWLVINQVKEIIGIT